jgi:adenylate kinase
MTGPKIIIAGAPASGKGTQCELIKERFGVVHLSTGDMLREAAAQGTEMGLLAKQYMDEGKLVPDEVIIGAGKWTLQRRMSG